MAYPSDLELTQVVTLKTWAQITGPEADTALTDLIKRVSGAICRHLNRPALINRSVTETRNGQEGLSQRMMLHNTPVTEITSLTIDGVAVPASTSPSVNGYTADNKVLYLRGNWYFTKGYQNITVVYKAGYAAASGEQLAIEQAALIVATALWKRRADAGKSSQSMQGIGNISVNPRDWPPEAKAILNDFRRRAAVAA